jgi:hypothetical protein
VSIRRVRRLLVAATIVAVLVPASAQALLLPPLVPPKLPPIPAIGYSKPAVVTHDDVAPDVPGGAAASVTSTAATLPEPLAPEPDGSGAIETHEVDASSSTGSDLPVRVLDGTNRITFGSFRDGDMVVVFDITSFTGHSGLFDRRYYNGALGALAMWSANIAPVNGVQREACSKYRAYDRAYGLWVPSEANHRVAARDFAARQIGKHYDLFAAKTDLRTFYCSKLLWAAWRYTSGLDLDADKGYWVWPVDLLNSRYTRIFGYWN